MKLVNLIVIFAFCFVICLGQDINLCYSENGWLELINDNTIVPISRENGRTTVFLQYSSTYKFKCVQNHSQAALKKSDITLGKIFILSF